MYSKTDLQIQNKLEGRSNDPTMLKSPIKYLPQFTNCKNKEINSLCVLERKSNKKVGNGTKLYFLQVLSRCLFHIGKRSHNGRPADVVPLRIQL